jgi:hypothetical protein
VAIKLDRRHTIQLTQIVGAIAVEELHKISPFVVNLPGLPESLKRIDRNIVVVPSEQEFLSFTARRPLLNRWLPSKDYRSAPLPNVVTPSDCPITPIEPR